MRANIRDKSFPKLLVKKLCLCQVSLASMMSESKFQYMHFCNVGSQTANLLYWCHDMLEWEWKETRFYKVSWQNSKCCPRRSLSPPTTPHPSIPNFTYPTQIVWFWVQPALPATVQHMFYGYTLDGY
jgi:hypothetical protein